MKKNIKSFLLLSAGLLILASIVLILHLTQTQDIVDDQPDQPGFTNTVTVFTDFAADDVVSIHIINQSDTGYTITAGENGSGFTIIQLDEKSSNIPYNHQQLLEAATIAANISSRLTAEENAADLDKYELTNPRSQVEVTFADGTVFEFSVGAQTPVGGDVYFKTGDSNDVYTIARHMVSLFFGGRHSWLNKTVFEQYDSAGAPVIERVTIERKNLDVPMIIQSIPETALEETRTFNSHRLISPHSVEIDAGKSRNIIFGIFGLSAKDIIEVAPDNELLETAGILEPACRVEVVFGEQTYVLTIGNRVLDENRLPLGWFGTSSHVPDILFLFEESSLVLPWLSAQPEHLISEMFLTPYIYSLERVVIHAGDIDIDYAITEDAQEDFRDLYQFLVSARGEELFTQEGGGELIARVEYHYLDESLTPDIVEFFTADNRRSIIRLNGENLFKVRQMYTTRLTENIQAYIDGREIIHVW
jgi:hypothetical protein